MKTKLTLLFLVSFFLTQSNFACPVWLQGIIKVVDENNKPIEGALVWKLYCETDSYSLSRDEWTEDMSEPVDTNAFLYYTYGGWGYDDEACKPSAYMFRITAPGFADVLISNVVFKNGDGFENNPQLTVTMYHHRFVRKGDYFIRFESYSCSKDIEVKDSTVLKFSDYVEALYAETSVEEAERVHSAGIKTYPNPVKDVLRVEINSDILTPHRCIITDISGKQVQTFEITESISTLDLSFENAGMYFISVFNAEGEMKYCVRFVKGE